MKLQIAQKILGAIDCSSENFIITETTFDTLKFESNVKDQWSKWKFECEFKGDKFKCTETFDNPADDWIYTYNSVDKLCKRLEEI